MENSPLSTLQIDTRLLTSATTVCEVHTACRKISVIKKLYVISQVYTDNSISNRCQHVPIIHVLFNNRLPISPHLTEINLLTVILITDSIYASHLFLIV